MIAGVDWHWKHNATRIESRFREVMRAKAARSEMVPSAASYRFGQVCPPLR